MCELLMKNLEIWRKILTHKPKFVLFSNDTIVVTDKKERAVELMKQWGPVVVGTSSGDFNVIALDDDLGWVVTYDHEDILTYVGADDFNDGGKELKTSEDYEVRVAVGLTGRGKRALDAEELNVVHVE